VPVTEIHGECDERFGAVRVALASARISAPKASIVFETENT
jgi:hypothetical protein